MLNKLSFNLMNELNESETQSHRIKKKVIMESDRVICEDHQLYYDDIQNMSTEERHELWMTYHDKDFEDTDKGNDMFWDWAEEEFPVKELNDSEEPTHQVLNEENSDAVDRLFSGNELYFRNADGTAIMIHYADNYPQPEEYDEGYKTELGGSEEALNAAQLAAENGDVWELVEVDNEGNSNGTIYGYAYGIDELKEYLKDLREVKVKKSLEEDMIDDNIEAARQDSIEKGLTSESEETDLDEPSEDDNKNILQAKKDELEARLGEILMSIKDKQMDTDEFRALSREAAEIDSQITDLDNQINGLYETELNESQNLELKNASKDPTWITGKVNVDDKSYDVQAKVYMEDSNFGIDNGKISKLIVYNPKDNTTIIDYDRGWNKKPDDKSSEDLYNYLISELYKFRDNHPYNVNNIEENNKPITEANVSKKIMLKNQGNIYMFECKGNKDFTHIVGENYNESENLLENVETYTSKEEADKDYLKRCGITTESQKSKDIEDGLDESDDLEKRNILLRRLISMYPDISEEDEDFFSTLSYEELKKEILNWGFDLGELDLDESSKVVASGLAKDGGKYKKIDLYVDGKYYASTNSYKTVKEAIAALKNKDEYKDKKVTGEFSKQ